VGKGRGHGAKDAARDLFRGLLESAPDAVVIVDEAGIVVLANRRVVPMFGYEPDELLGRSVEILVPERYRVGHQAQREGFLRDPVVRPMGSGRDLHAVRKDGAEVPVEIWLSTLETDDGVLVSAAVRDTSERRRLQREADRLRDELVATVSHELRTPLTSIIGYVELLDDLEGDALSEEGRRMLGVIERNAHRELHLVNDLLDLGSIRATTVDVQHRVELAPLVRASAEGARVTARARGVELVADVPDGLEVLGDPQRLGQVLDNLVGNALKFSSPGGTVTIAGGQDGQDGQDGTVWLEVRDEGTGIPEEELPRIFDRLYRSSDAVRQQVPGAGLGLTIAQAIVEAHGGRIGATSRVGAGTTVRVELPAPGVSAGEDA
jgi:protein-histidine pros-kinase